MTQRLFHLAAVVLCLSATALLHPGDALGHDFDPERELLIQVFPTHVDILILYTEAPDERSDFFAAKFGLRGQGSTAPFFQELASRAILPRMLDGLEFEVKGERPRTAEPEVRLKNVEGRVMAAAFVRYDLPELSDDGQRTFVVRAAERSFVSTRAVIYGGQGRQLVEHGESPLTHHLFRGDELITTFARPGAER